MEHDNDLLVLHQIHQTVFFFNFVYHISSAKEFVYLYSPISQICIATAYNTHYP